MKTLQDAWEWYAAARINLSRMQRLGKVHWAHDSLQNASIWTDEQFKRLEAVDIEVETTKAMRPLDDLGVLVLFSVFEAAVRDRLEGVIKPLTARLVHPILKDAGENVLDGIKQGSFANKVLAPLQSQGHISAEIANKVRQVRDYRNWVAHGKREPRPNDVIKLVPEEAFTRLEEFLNALGIAVKAELAEIKELGDTHTDDESA